MHESYQSQEVQELELTVAARIELDFRLRPLNDVWEAGEYKSVFLPGSKTIVTFYGPDVDPSKSGSFEAQKGRRAALESSVSEVIDSGEISATRRRMMPAFSRRWMRFQHGLCDRPTRWAICAKERLASSWRSATIFLSIASMIQSPKAGRPCSALTALSGLARQISTVGLSDRLGFQTHRRAEPPGQGLGQGLDVAVERSGIARQPPVGAVEP